jgi:hypothetical protein
VVDARMRVVIVAAHLAAACGGSQDIEAARRASYDTDRAVVFREALAATEALFPSVEGDEAAGTIATGWQLVDGVGQRSRPQRPPPNIIERGPVSNFVRFDIAITGGPPWRVEVTGHGHEAKLWTSVPYDVPDDTAWVVAPTNLLVRRIHERLASYAR